MKEKTRKLLEKIIKNRSYFDGWSVAHIIFGVVVGLILKEIGLLFITAVFASLSVFTFWEIIEPGVFKFIIKKEFTENRTNQIMDLFYGFVGFLVYWYIF